MPKATRIAASIPVSSTSAKSDDHQLVVDRVVFRDRPAGFAGRRADGRAGRLVLAALSYFPPARRRSLTAAGGIFVA